jgi:integrase
MRRPVKKTNADGEEEVKPGASARTVNSRLTALRAFAKWLTGAGRLQSDPLVNGTVAKLNVDTDRRHERRALSDEELAKLFQVTKTTGGEWLGVTGSERSLIYRLGAWTGLRANEIRSLSVTDFDLKDLDAATVTVEAANAKNRRRDTLPLRKELAQDILNHIRTKGIVGQVKVFSVPEKTAAMLRSDLKRSKIDYKVDGKVADFHSLRASLATRLAKAGIPPQITMQIMRHSSVDLTLRFYTFLGVSDHRAALLSLPQIKAVENNANVSEAASNA